MGEIVPLRRQKQPSVPLLLPLLVAAAATSGAYAWLNAPAVFDAAPAKLASVTRTGMKRCLGPVRITCVVDGDTFWLDGEKIRIENIDAPEMHGRCTGEPVKAEQATRRLSQLLDGRISLARFGKDKYGRTLARVIVDGDDVGDMLLQEGLVRAWPDGSKTWCAG